MGDTWRNNKSNLDPFADFDPCPPMENTMHERRTFTNSRGRARGRFSRDGRQSQNYNNRWDDRDRDRDQKHTIYVDANKLSKLIGKQGSNIRDLQEKSNTRININRTGDESVPVHIIGSRDAQLNAERMINEFLNGNSSAPEGQNVQYGVPEQQMQNTEPQQYNNTQQSQENVADINFDWSKALDEYDVRQKERWSKLPPITKNFYREDESVTNMTEEQVARIRLINNNTEAKYVFEIDNSTSEDLHIPNPVETFEQAFKHYPEILEEVRKQGFEKPSPIQCQAWPVLLSGKDLIGIAQTGTGKTLAFLLPALIHIDGQDIPRRERSGPTVLILAPTRELALQIDKEVSKYSYRGIKAVCVYGGGNRKQQIDVVTKGVEIVIATPGRLNDLIQTRLLSLTSVSYLVLDEADRMLDLGFEPQIKMALSDVRPDRQTIMTSATWPQGVRRLAQSYMKNPVQVCVGSLNLAAVHSVTQKICLVDEEEKINMLHEFIRGMSPDEKVIVFIGKKTRVDHIASDFALQGIDCQSIHGGREQLDREQALSDLKHGVVQILLATDVASRGIDIENISHVINFDFPRDMEDYVHRVGRTGRAGKTGQSVTLMTRQDWNHAEGLIKILEEANQEVPRELYKMAERCKVWKEKRAQERNALGTSRYGPRSNYRSYN